MICSRVDFGLSGPPRRAEGVLMTIVRDSFYINGEWVKAVGSETLEVTSSGTGELFATVPVGTVD